MSNKEPKFWFTTKTGKHIPVYEGESKADALKRALGSEKATQQTQKSSAKSVSTSKSSSNAEKKSVSTVKNNDKKETKVQKVEKKVEKQPEKQVQTQKKPESQPVKKKESAEERKQREISEAKTRMDRINAEKSYEESLKMGNKVGIKNGHLTFKGKEVPDFNTTGAMSELDRKSTNSLADYLDEDGNLSPERLAVHRKIIEEYFGDKKPYAPGEEKKALFTGGGGASGKGFLFTNKDDWKYSSNDNPVIVDADKLKTMLNEYDFNSGRQDVSKKLTDFTTGWYHEESSALAKQIYQMCLDNNYPVMYDGTATGRNYPKLIKQAQEHGYRTEMNFLFSDWNTVRNNSMIRYLNSDRLVPLEHQLSAHANAYDAVMRINDMFDSFSLWDNRAIGTNSKTGKYMYKAKKIATNTKGGQLKILDDKSWNFFKNAQEEFEHNADKKIEFGSMQKSVESFKVRKSKTDDAYAGYAALKVDKGRKWLKEHGNNVPNNERY